jgi:hypothetical protein
MQILYGHSSRQEKPDIIRGMYLCRTGVNGKMSDCPFTWWILFLDALASMAGGRRCFPRTRIRCSTPHIPLMLKCVNVRILPNRKQSHPVPGKSCPANVGRTNNQSTIASEVRSGQRPKPQQQKSTTRETQPSSVSSPPSPSTTPEPRNTPAPTSQLKHAHPHRIDGLPPSCYRRPTRTPHLGYYCAQNPAR